MAQHAVERLERHVAAVQLVEHADGLHVMEKITTRTLVIDIVEETLAGMAKGRVAQIVAQANRLDQIAVEAQGTADIAGNARDELHMKAAPRQIVVAAKAKDLRFACITRVRRKMKDLFGVAHKCRSHERAFVGSAINTTNDLVIAASIRINDTRGAVGGDTLDQLGRQRRGNAVHARLNDGRFLISCHGMLLKKDAQSVTMCSPRPRLWQKSAQKTGAMAGSAIL